METAKEAEQLRSWKQTLVSGTMTLKNLGKHAGKHLSEMLTSDDIHISVWYISWSVAVHSSNYLLQPERPLAQEAMEVCMRECADQFCCIGPFSQIRGDVRPWSTNPGVSFKVLEL